MIVKIVKIYVGVSLVLLWQSGVSSFSDSSFLILLLSHFSRVRLCATPEMAAYQALPSLGFSRQEHWSGLPLPSPREGHCKQKTLACAHIVSATLGLPPLTASVLSLSTLLRL